jgi:hypothetical protein
LWSPTHAHIASWLASVQPHSNQLLLLGPSAGWMLPSAWLQRFESIHAMDMDPLARGLFTWRHGPALKAAGVLWQYHSGDALAELPRLLTAHPKACVLFDNLLGQLRFHAPAWKDPTIHIPLQLARLKRLLQGREWGSVHDLVSGPAAGLPLAQDFPAVRRSLKPPGDGQPPDLEWLAAAKPQGPWLDHLTDQVFPAGTALQDIAWAFKPAYWHWLQAAWVQPGKELPQVLARRADG